MRLTTNGSDRGWHFIADDLREDWWEDWAAVGIEQLGDCLRKYAAFEDFVAGKLPAKEPEGQAAGSEG